MAASCGDEKTEESTEDGEREPVLDSVFLGIPRQLGVLRGKLAVDKLWRRDISRSFGVTGRGPGKSVRTDRPANGLPPGCWCNALWLIDICGETSYMVNGSVPGSIREGDRA